MNLRLFQNTIFAVVAATLIAHQTATAKDLRARRLTTNAPELAVQAAALSPDGKFIAYADPLGIHVRSLANGETHLLAGTDGHLLVRWTSNGSGLVARLQDSAGIAKTRQSGVAPNAGPLPTSRYGQAEGCVQPKHEEKK